MWNLDEERVIVAPDRLVEAGHLGRGEVLVIFISNRLANVVGDPPQQRVEQLRRPLLREEVTIVRSWVDCLRHISRGAVPEGGGQQRFSVHALGHGMRGQEEGSAFRDVESRSQNGSLLRNIGAVSWQGLGNWVAAQPKRWLRSRVGSHEL